MDVGGGVGSSRGPGTEFGTEISAKGQREPLDPEILSHHGAKPLAKLHALAWGGGSQVTQAAGLDVHLIIPTASPWA